MQIAKVELDQRERVALIQDDKVLTLSSLSLSDVLYADAPSDVVEQKLQGDEIPLSEVKLLPPVDQQEVWAAGVTYIRSREARERESEGAAKFYDLVYSADRPELFFKSPPYRVVATEEEVRIRRDSKWSVPEPEVALVLSPDLRIVGYTIGNDMSSRDIEGENPLYLPQAKMYDGSCALGPVITLAEAMPSLESVGIQMTIERAGTACFQGETTLKSMARSFEDLVGWSGREMSFPNGAILMTGTGIVTHDHFTLSPGDRITIRVDGIGSLINTVAQHE